MKVAVESIYDTFEDRFLGVKTNDPTLDNDGNALLDGAMYFNGSSNALKVYSLDNTTWYTIPQIYLSGLLDVTLTSITTGDILTLNGTKWVNTRTPSFDSVKLNGGTSTAGTATWNNTELTYDLVLNDNVTLQVGQEEVVYCKNNTLITIPNGKPVMAVGTNGNSGNILVDLHDGTKASAKRIIGLTTQPILPSNNVNPYGFVTRNGKVRGLNTTGSDYGETWVDGDILYVKATGALTKVVPVDTELKMPIAFVIHAHTNGTLYVRTTGIDENHYIDLISTKIAKVTSTDNAIVRFDGITGVVQNSGVVIDDSGNIGIGVVPSAWYGGKHLQTNYSAFGENSAGYADIQNNSYEYASNSYKYILSGLGASRYIANFGNHQWFTAPSGTAGNPITWTNAMNLDTSGNLFHTYGGVYSYSINGFTSSDYANSFINIKRWSLSDTTAVLDHQVVGVRKAAILANGTFQSATNVYGSTSDIKLKENIVDATPKLDKLMNVKVKNFNYIGKEDKQIGVIAQEIEEVFPSVVFETKDTKQVEVIKERIIPAVDEIIDAEGNIIQEAKPESIEEYTEFETQETGEVTKNVKYSIIYMMMLKGMQEQQEIINALKERIETLEGAK